jgi:hypothetical protein
MKSERAAGTLWGAFGGASGKAPGAAATAKVGTDTAGRA